MNLRPRGYLARSKTATNVIRAPAEAGLTSRPKYASMPEFGVVVLESRHAANWSGPAWFDEDFNKFLFVVSGAVRLRTLKATWDLRPDSLVHVVAHTPHSNADLPAEPVVVYVIHYQAGVLPATLAAALRRQPIMQWNLIASRSNVARAVRQDLQQMLYEQVIRRVGWQALLISILIRMAVRVLRVGERHTSEVSGVSPAAMPSLQRVADYVAGLESGFYRSQSLDEAAARARLSRRQFTELFRRVTGQSWRQNVLAMRLNHAARLLVETGKSVTEIVFECGFENLSHFYHKFKSAYGCSPQFYRERHFTAHHVSGPAFVSPKAPGSMDEHRPK